MLVFEKEEVLNSFWILFQVVEALKVFFFPSKSQIADLQLLSCVCLGKIYSSLFLFSSSF